jgi:predicted  nucleic acid-binding Zn-ribbon protein
MQNADCDRRHAATVQQLLDVANANDQLKQQLASVSEALRTSEDRMATMQQTLSIMQSEWRSTQARMQANIDALTARLNSSTTTSFKP